MVHPGRVVGVVMGLVILASVFILPFATNPPTTLFQIIRPLIENPGFIPSLSSPAAVLYAYTLIFSFILLTVAGLVGVFPLGTGVLGVVALAVASVVPYFLFPGMPQPVWGLGFYAAWAASAVSLGASFWHGRSRQPQQPTIVFKPETHVVQTTAPPPPPPPPPVACRYCGSLNSRGARYCSRCGRPMA
ncbi:MAG: zinc ribbon domain-containing protein [Candidatus Caldarchaeum sp.]